MDTSQYSIYTSTELIFKIVLINLLLDSFYFTKSYSEHILYLSVSPFPIFQIFSFSYYGNRLRLLSSLLDTHVRFSEIGTLSAFRSRKHGYWIKNK